MTGTPRRRGMEASRHPSFGVPVPSDAAAPVVTVSIRRPADIGEMFTGGLADSRAMSGDSAPERLTCADSADSF